MWWDHLQEDTAGHTGHHVSQWATQVLCQGCRPGQGLRAHTEDTASRWWHRWSLGPGPPAFMTVLFPEKHTGRHLVADPGPWGLPTVSQTYNQDSCGICPTKHRGFYGFHFMIRQDHAADNVWSSGRKTQPCSLLAG